MQEKRFDDYWNVDSNRSLSDSWKGFTKFTPLKEKPPKGYTWSGRRWTKVLTTTRPDHVWPEVWTQIGKAAQNREKQEWKNEKPKLGNARRLRGIYFIDPDDQDYKETLKNARRKLERPMAAVMPCKRTARTSNTKVAAEEIASQKVSKTIHRCAVEFHESIRQRVDSSPPAKHEGYIAGKGNNSLQHFYLVHKFIPMPQAMKILDAKAAVDKEWEEARDNPSMANGTSQE